MNSRSVPIVSAVGVLTVLYGCAETSTRMIQANDQYCIQQAQELREKGKHWEHTAEYYVKHSEPHSETEPKQYAAHSPSFAQNNLSSG